MHYNNRHRVIILKYYNLIFQYIFICMFEQFTWIDIPQRDQCYRAFVLLRTLPSNRKIHASAMVD